MRRVVYTALASALLATAGTASAQVAAQQMDAGPRLRITPFVGQAPQFERKERWNVSDGVLAGSFAIETPFASGAAVGGVVEARLTEKFSFVASGVYIARRSTIDFETSELDPGANFLLAKAGVALRLRESVSEMQLRQLSASIFAAPALVREMPKDDLSVDPALTDAINHYGLNLGFEAEIPLNGDFVALQFGAEDFVVWWNESELADRFDRGAAGGGFATTSTVETDPSHMWVFRAGLTFRLR